MRKRIVVFDCWFNDRHTLVQRDQTPTHHDRQEMGTNSRPTHRNKRNATKNCMKSKTATLGILLLFTNRLLWAQAPPVDPLAENLFPPELVMQYPSEIGLTEDQESVQRWQNEGRDPSPVAELMQELEPLMKQAKHKEAEALLDRALKLLNEPEKDKK